MVRALGGSPEDVGSNPTKLMDHLMPPVKVEEVEKAQSTGSYPEIMSVNKKRSKRRVEYIDKTSALRFQILLKVYNVDF